MNRVDMDISIAIRSLGGIATRDQILAFGIAPGAISAAVRDERVIRIRRAWYGVPETPFDHRAAVALGGRLGGLSGARSYGLWTGELAEIHVSWHRHGNVAVAGRRQDYGSLRQFGGVRIVPHWRTGRHPPVQLWREPPEEMLRQVIATADRATVAAVCDSAVREGALVVDVVRALLTEGPESVRVLVEIVDGIPDSGIETKVRVWLWINGVRHRLHAVIHGLEVDFLVGDSLVIETDGAAFHTGSEAFERDRRRDSILASAGYVVVRFSYRQIVDDWPACERRIREHMARGDHLRPVR
jgi:very-short-patch-repair endonuclease